MSNAVRCTIVLAGIISLLSIVSCNKEEVKEPDPAQDLFRQMKMPPCTAGAETIAVIQVKDSVGTGPDLQRQVLEEIQSQLHNLGDVGVIEYPQSRLEQTFTTMGITPSEGISPRTPWLWPENSRPARFCTRRSKARPPMFTSRFIQVKAAP